MKFTNLARYSDLARIAGARPAHFAYADDLRARGKLAIGGPLVDGQGRRIALLFVYEAASKDEALSFVAHDPFTLANALSSYEVSEWCLREADLDVLIEANRAARDGGGGSGGSQRRLFLIYARYADESKVAALRAAHRSYVQALSVGGKLAMAGSLADDSGELLVYSAANREDATSLVAQDPFALGGVFAAHELLEWLVEGVRPELLAADPVSAGPAGKT